MNIEQASRYSMHNRNQLERSSQAACYYCEKVFTPDKIVGYADDNDTALCPHCGVDSVLGSESGFSFDEKTLKELHNYWFN